MEDVPLMKFRPGERALRPATGKVYTVRSCTLDRDEQGQLYWDYLLVGFNETLGRRTHEYVVGAQLAEVPE